MFQLPVCFLGAREAGLGRSASVASVAVIRGLLGFHVLSAPWGQYVTLAHKPPKIGALQ